MKGLTSGRDGGSELALMSPHTNANDPETDSMTMTIATIQRANHGSHFRAYGLRGAADLIDPFIGVDHAWMSQPTFPPHPHAGFSAVSYVFLDSETGIRNSDSIGTRHLIQPGGLHWTTAGQGVVHEEVPDEPGKTVHSLQIFVDLPPGKKDVDPFALSLEPQDVPVVHLPGAKVRVPLGRYGDAVSPLRPPTNVDLLDISLEGGAEVIIAAGNCAFFMPIFGVVAINGQHFDPEDLRAPVLSAQDAPHAVRIFAPRGFAKVAVFNGRPFRSART